jgi:hypothetical protein
MNTKKSIEESILNSGAIVHISKNSLKSDDSLKIKPIVLVFLFANSIYFKGNY